MKTYRVNLIRSERACTREGLEPKATEVHIGDFDTLEEAKEAYDNTETGTEVDKVLLLLDDENNISEEIETTYS